VLGELVNHIGKAAYPLFERFSAIAWDNAPRPASARAVTRGVGHDPDRILLAGGSSAVGWGVMNHDLALAGHLARATSAFTGRGTDVEVFSYPRLDIPALHRELTPEGISRLDALVLTLGGRESFELMSARLWRKQVEGLLDHITSGRREAPSIIIVGAEESSPIPLGGGVASMAMSRARALNQATRDVIASRDRVVYVESGFVPRPGTTSVFDDAVTVYERAALAIAPTLASLLEHAPDRLRQPVDEDARAHAIRHLRDLDGADYPKLHTLLETAKDVLHLRSADLFFVDSDEVRLIAATSVSQVASPRANSLSTEILEHRRGLVIPDLAADPRHHHRPQVTGPPHLRFYAGYPVESPDGQPVAVFAVVDTRPRKFSPPELSLLRNFAVQAGDILFEGYEP
jgi:hypothetical protein